MQQPVGSWRTAPCIAAPHLNVPSPAQCWRQTAALRRARSRGRAHLRFGRKLVPHGLRLGAGCRVWQVERAIHRVLRLRLHLRRPSSCAACLCARNCCSDQSHAKGLCLGLHSSSCTDNPQQCLVRQAGCQQQQRGWATPVEAPDGSSRRLCPLNSTARALPAGPRQAGLGQAVCCAEIRHAGPRRPSKNQIYTGV